MITRRVVSFVVVNFVAALLAGFETTAQQPRPAAKPVTAWSAADGIVARQAPSESASPATGPALTFLEPLLVVRQQGETPWFLVARRSQPSTTVGWVPGDVLIRRASAEVVAGSGSPRLVVVVNTVLSLQPGGPDDRLRVPVRRAPSADSPPTTTIPLLNLAFRYAESGDFALIGPEPRFPSDADSARAARAVLGWVPRELILAYESRRGVAWDRSSTLPDAPVRRKASGTVFRGQAAAYDDDGTTRRAVLFEEQADENGVGLPLTAAEPRMPILPYLRDDEFPQINPNTGNELLRVGGIGALLGEDQRPPTAEEDEAIRLEMQSLRERLNTARQVVFVMDDTNSMGAHFPRVARTVQRIVEDAVSNVNETVEVAVSYYNDARGGRPPGFQPMRLVNARSPAGKNLIDQVQRHVLTNGGDYPEMVAEGLDAALDAANFEARPGATRLVVLIGDHGNRDDPDYDRLVEKITRRGRGPIELVVVQVVDPERPDPSIKVQDRPIAQDSAQKFFTQMNALIDRLNRAEGADGRPTASFVPMVDEGASLTEVLNQKYDAMKSRQRELEATYALMLGRRFPTRTGTELERLLAERSVPIDRLRALVGVRVAEEGFVWRWLRPPGGGMAGVPLVREAALLSRAEVRELVSLLEPILRASDPIAAMRVAVGIDPSGTVEGSILKPRGGLPANSLILRRKVDELTSELVKSLLPAATARLVKLKALAEAESTRWFSLHGGETQWCWIDVEQELP